jgi:hypothetical protein
MMLMRRPRDVLEDAARDVTEQAAVATSWLHKALDAGLGDSHPVTLHANTLRLELVRVNAGLERDLG